MKRAFSCSTASLTVDVGDDAPPSRYANTNDLDLPESCDRGLERNVRPRFLDIEIPILPTRSYTL